MARPRTCRRRLLEAALSVIGAAGSSSVAADTLFAHGADRVWRRSDGSLTLLTATNGTTFTDASGEYRLEGGSGSYRLNGPGGATLVFENGRRAPSEDPVAECQAYCDAAAQPPPPSTTTPSIAGALSLDLRPASCRSYFTDYPPVERGSRIEIALADEQALPGALATIRSFPQADFISEHELVVVHSRDLASVSLDPAIHPDALYELLLRDAAAIESELLAPLEALGVIARHEGGVTTRLEHDPSRATVLILLVRHGMASANQRDQIARARLRMAAELGIELRVVEIP